jgi:hypothetical protein
VKIRIQSCRHPSQWYADKIGQVLIVSRHEVLRHPHQCLPEDVYWCCTDDAYKSLNYVLCSDATPLDAAMKGQDR